MRNEGLLADADKWLARAIAYQATDKRPFRWTKCLDKACLFELAGLGYCSLMPRKEQLPMTGKFVEREVAPPYNPYASDYIDFGNVRHKAVSHAMH